MNKIECPKCLGQGHVIDPVLESSVLDTGCPVCRHRGKIESSYVTQTALTWLKPKILNL